MLTLVMPTSQLELAYGRSLTGLTTARLATERDDLSRYLLMHVGVRTGRLGWQVRRPELSLAPDDSLQARFEVLAPHGVSPRQFSLMSDAIVHQVRNHRVEVFLRQDWDSGHVAIAPRPLGEWRADQTAIEVKLASAGTWASLIALWQLGVTHIATGADHMLFLILLIAVAPLTAHREQWQADRSLRDSLRHVLWVVTAFTIGHMVTLTLGSLGVLTPSTQAVEIGVALTIAVTAAHLGYPLFPRKEALVAGLFGLIHGLAFSGSLNSGGLTPWQHAQAVLAFNIGIECMQALALCVCLPPWLSLSRHAPQLVMQLNLGLSCTAMLLAGLWLIDRTGLTPGLELPGEASVAMLWPWLAAALWALALWQSWRARQGAHAG